MVPPIHDEEIAARRAKIVASARWCFLNFGFAKTTFNDIAKRAHLSRTLLYRAFRDKEEIFQAVFMDWLLSRRDSAQHAAVGTGSAYDRLIDVCRMLVIEPWSEMAGTAMGHDFLDTCGRIDPDSEALYRTVIHTCLVAILGDDASAEVFLLALDGLLSDQPKPEVLEQRTRLLASRFASGSFEGAPS